MKKKKIVLLSLPLLTAITMAFVLSPGKTLNLTEGKIVYQITFPETEMEENMAAVLPTESVLYVKNDKSRLDQKSAMGFNISVISDSKTKTQTMLMDMMGNKWVIKTTEADLQKEREGKPKPEIKLEKETREIAGYTCNKATLIFKDKEGNSESSTIYYCKDISTKTGNWSNPDFKDIQGVMMQYEEKRNGMNMRMTAKSVSAEKVDDNLFKVPADYKEVSMQDFKKMFQGGGQ